ncbi:MAG: tRNA pseudouridine(55) synthase TruB [Lachnospiraceae bacterium]|nr:tRNA pseudouridine(55) synthase TruB [uncultured Acetatifactor sp.]MCI8286404.1 tRNA pseudouridine(55) synthase TruB [Lachnospiraceae bacterium]
MINGVVIIHKMPDFTSHDVVAKMRGICGQKKVGHTGTLDPMATGVLPVCLGSATKVCDMLADRDKEYVAELLLGVVTDTQDITGKVLAQHNPESSEEKVQEAILSFQGEYSQIPPMYSALKVNGKKLYELARAGKEVERRPRTVFIRELEILECSLPVVRFRTVCSKGTYIRTLCADIGEKLGCGGTMQSLRRTAVGEFRLENGYKLEEMQQLKDTGRLEEAILPVDSVFSGCPVLHVRKDYGRLLENGNAILPEQTVEKKVYAPERWVRMYGADKGFCGIYAYEAGRKWYRPVKMFLEKE